MTYHFPSKPSRASSLTLCFLILLSIPLPASPQEGGNTGQAAWLRLIELKGELLERLETLDPECVPLAEQVLELTALVLGPEHPEIVAAFTHLAYAQQAAGSWLEARGHYEVALGLSEKILGPEHPLTGVVLNHSGVLLGQLGEETMARSRLEEALRIMTKVFGPRSIEAVVPLSSLGNLLHSLGDYPTAREHLAVVVEVTEEQHGPDHPETATALGNLAMVLVEQGELSEALAMMERAVMIDRLAFGDGHLGLATDFLNLAAIHQRLGDALMAKFYLEKSLAISREKLPSHHPLIATSLNNLGHVLNDLRLFEEAEQVLRRARDLQAEALGPGHPSLVCIAGALQESRRGAGRERSPPLGWESAIPELEEGHQKAIALNNTACADLDLGDFETATHRLHRALEMREGVLGASHPDLVPLLMNLAAAEAQAGHFEQAIASTERALDIEEHMFETLVPQLGLEQAELFLDESLWHTTWALTLQLRAGEPATRLALTAVLRRKGRAFELLVPPGSRLEDAEIEEFGSALRAAREEWAFLHLQGGSVGGPHTDRLCRLWKRIRLLDGELRGAHDRLSENERPRISVEAVQAELPDGTVLIEIYHVDPTDAAVQLPRGSPRYFAYILHPTGAPSWIDLGEAERIDKAAKALLSALSRPVGDPRAASRELFRLVFEPIQPSLDAAALLISPDGILNLVPFAALQDEEGAYLLESYAITYLGSGRDLLRGDAPPSREPPLILGDPEVATLGATHHPALAGLEPLFWRSLPGTREEARRVASTLKVQPDRLKLGSHARELAVKSVRGPRILHLATHGLYLGEVVPVRGELPACLDLPGQMDPLLRSMVILSATDPVSAADDGILTASEVADLDLHGTEIVTLSACETGVGEVRPGRGIYGLRQALSLAGARTQVISLWPVDDLATAALMSSFYAQLAEGESRGEAIRNIQLAGLAGGPLPVTDERIPRGATPLSATESDETHPYYWAGFVLVGDTGPVEIIHEPSP